MSQRSQAIGSPYGAGEGGGERGERGGEKGEGYLLDFSNDS